RDSGLSHDRTETRENGQPVALPFSLLDGQVLLTAARPWVGGFERSSLDLGDMVVVYGPAEETIVLVADPPGLAAGCGSGPIPADAHGLARSLRSDPGLQVSSPAAVRVGGADALTMDVVLAPGADDCAVIKLHDGQDHRGAHVHTGGRMRLYLFDT